MAEKPHRIPPTPAPSDPAEEEAPQGFLPDPLDETIVYGGGYDIVRVPGPDGRPAVRLRFHRPWKRDAISFLLSEDAAANLARDLAGRPADIAIAGANEVPGLRAKGQ